MTSESGRRGTGATKREDGQRRPAALLAAIDGQRVARPAISVIIPAFNAEATLAETLRSVEVQSFADFEAIILDDGSQDATAAIAAAFAARDERFVLVRLSNGGPSRARNIGAFEHAAGDLLAFLDSDDLFAADKLARMAAVFAPPAAPDAVYARIAFFRGAPETARTRSSILPRPLTITDLLCENPVCTMSNIVVRADRFRTSGGFDPALVHAEDVDWLIRMIADGARIEGLDETLVHYRTSDGGLSSDLRAMRRGWHVARTAAEAAGVTLGAPAIRAAEAAHWRYLARRALRMDAPRTTALSLALRGIACSPSGFFGDARRGGLTLAAAVTGLVLPAAARRRLFA